MFAYILLFSSLIISACAGWFSLSGFGKLFSGATVAIMIMAGSLELGKIVSTTLTYRYWNKLNKFLRIYLILSCIILSIITSTGVYGYLTSAYSNNIVVFNTMQSKIDRKQETKDKIDSKIKINTDRINSLQNSLEKQQSNLSNLAANEKSYNAYRSQRNLSVNINFDIKQLSKQNDSLQMISELTANDILTIKESLNYNNDIITFKYFADAVGIDLNRFVQYFVLCIVIVFDPLALSLLIGYNVIKKNERGSGDEVVPTQQVSYTGDNPIVDAASPAPEPLPVVETIKGHDGPYYTDPAYNWDTDDRWKYDVNASRYRERLS